MNNLSIIFENDDVVVVDKPNGLLVHSDGSLETTVVDWFVDYCPLAVGVGDSVPDRETPEERSGVVHRLDKDTSGALLLTKNQESFEYFKKAFQNREVKKTYLTYVYGHMKAQWGTIDRPIGRSAKDFRLRSAQRGAKGTLREAYTDWECIKNLTYQDELYAYLKLQPKTGRMHQLRVHLKAIDRPIVGDTLYAGKKLTQSNNLGLNRLALHAYQLEVLLPDGERKCFESPIPKSFDVSVD